MSTIRDYSLFIDRLDSHIHVMGMDITPNDVEAAEHILIDVFDIIRAWKQRRAKDEKVEKTKNL